MKILFVMRKALLEAWREPQLGFLLLVFPALLVLLYFYAYGNSGQGLAQMLNVQVVNQDAGPLGESLVTALRQAEFDGRPVYQVTRAADRPAAETALREGQAALLLVIPPDFSASLRKGAPAPANLTLVGDPNSDLTVFTQSFLMSTAQAFADGVTSWSQPSAVTWSFLPGTGKLSDFQFGVPGVLVFGILFGAMATAIVMVREEARATLRRLRLTRLTALELLGGVLAAQALLALAQMFLALGSAVLCGFQSPGSLLLAAGLGMLVSLIASSCGFITACFTHNDGEAASLSMVFIGPLAFLSGAVFPMPAAPLFALGGRTFQVYDLLPTAHATNALRRVLIYGDGLPQIGLEVAILLFSAALFLWVGAWLYWKLKLN